MYELSVHICTYTYAYIYVYKNTAPGTVRSQQAVQSTMVRRVCVYIHTIIHTYIYASSHTYMYKYIYVYMYMYVCIYVHSTGDSTITASSAVNHGWSCSNQ